MSVIRVVDMENILAWYCSGAKIDDDSGSYPSIYMSNYVNPSTPISQYMNNDYFIPVQVPGKEKPEYMFPIATEIAADLLKGNATTRMLISE